MCAIEVIRLRNVLEKYADKKSWETSEIDACAGQAHTFNWKEVHKYDQGWQIAREALDYWKDKKRKT